MRIIETIRGLQTYRGKLSQVGLVPTMGFLHDGHLSLVKKSRMENPHTIVSIFVNPKQFGPNEDFARYPRDLKKDCRMLEREGVDAVFAPTTEEMYPGDEKTVVSVKEISTVLCGKTRPGHFDGVATVVAKLFNIVQPHRAYFGQKDLQQTVVVRRMVEDLSLPVEIIVCPIIREKDGLAMSSRNSYLTPAERKIAPLFHQALLEGERLFRSGVDMPSEVRTQVISLLKKHFTPDYVEIVDSTTMMNVTTITPGAAIVAAIYLGKARLIDNVIL